MSHKIKKTFLFNEVRDQAILVFLEHQLNQSETVREALRLYMTEMGIESDHVTLEDIKAELEKLSRQIANIKTVSAAQEPTVIEPQDIVNKLTNFGK